MQNVRRLAVRMPDSPLQPGERVVELAGVVQSVAIFSGAVAASLTSWFAKRSWAVSGISFVVGAFVGFLVGMAAARVFYRTADGMTTIVRVGSSSLPATIRAGLAGGVLTALVVAAGSVLFLSAPAQSAFTTSLVCGAVIGVVFAFLGSVL